MNIPDKYRHFPTPVAKTVGELKSHLAELPDELPLGEYPEGLRLNIYMQPGLEFLEFGEVD